MSCDYQNINDMCNNRFSYQYKNVVFNGSTCVTDSSDTASVIRTDINNGREDIITPASSDNVEHCDTSIETEVISSWDCYLIYRQSNGNIADPDIEEFRSSQTKYITDSYNNALTSGINITIKNHNLILSGKLADQIYYRSLASMGQLLYNEDVDSVMPSFTDMNNTICQFNYDDFSSVFQVYFTNVIYLKTLKDYLVNQIQTSDSIVGIQAIVWNTSTKIEGEPAQSTPLQIVTSSTPVCNKYSPSTLSVSQSPCCVCLYTETWDCGYGYACPGIFYPDDNNDDICGCSLFIVYHAGSCSSMTSEQYADFSGQCAVSGGTIVTLTQECGNMQGVASV